jgi:acetyl esterase/lipase
MDVQDAAATSPTAVDAATLAETRSFNDELERLLATQPRVDTVPPEVTRAARRQGRGIFPAPVFVPHARDLAIPSRAGQLRIRVIAPQGRAATGVHLHIHGGGWTLGAADQQDVELAALAEATGLCVAGVDYRLAPEHPYPAGPDDCEDAALWLLERGAAELQAPARFTIGGESAGGQLAAVTLLRLRDRHGASGAFAAANLVYGCFDLSMTPSQRLWGERNLVLSDAIMRWFADNFLGGRDMESRRDPDISPLFARLHGMPPALFTVGDLDPLLDDSVFMEARWRRAGARTALRVWPEAIHGFTYFPIAVTLAARAEMYRFLAEALAG